MENIYLNDAAKELLRKLYNTENKSLQFTNSGMDSKSWLSANITLEKYGLIQGKAKLEGTDFGYAICLLTDKGIAYYNDNPELINPKTEEEIRAEDIKREWTINSINWIITLIAALVGGAIGFLLGKYCS